MNKNDKEIKEKRRKQARESSDLSKGVEIVNEIEKKTELAHKVKEKKCVNNKVRKIFKAFSLPIVIVLIIVLAKYRHIIGITFAREITYKDSVSIDLTTSCEQVIEYKDELLVVSKGKLETYSKRGKKTWEYTFDETFVPEVKVAGKYIEVINKDSGYIYVFSGKYESCRKKIEGTIKKSTINQKGQIAVCFSKEGIKSSVVIFNKRGKETYEVSLSSQNVVDIYLSNNSKYLLIYDLVTEGISAKSVIKKVNLNEKSKVEEMISIDGEIIYEMCMENYNLYFMTSSKTYNYNIMSNTYDEYDYTNKGLSYISLDNTGVAYIEKEIHEDKNTLVILNSSYKEISNNKFSESVKSFKYYNMLAYVACNNEIDVYNRWGMLVKKYTSNSIITNMLVFNNGKSIAINNSDSLVIINI